MKKFTKNSGRLPKAVFFTLLFSIGIAQQALAEKRIALVIGNSGYRDVPLTNPVNDAEDISEALRRTGFEVDTYTNVNRKQMREAIRVFGDKLRQADVGLFYFAGHGVQIKGRNYLIPLSFDVKSADEVQDESIDAGAVLRKMESAGNAVNIVILDACRNNPFARSFRSLENGLARMEGPVGSFIAYATAPGSVAADGNGRNGVYTAHLLEALRRPGLTIEQIFKRVRMGVKDETSGLQIPWESSSLMGEFVFLPAQQNAALQTVPAKPVPPPLAMKYLQVIANVPNASVSVNDVKRGMTGDEGVLNIENLIADEAEVTVQAKGYAPQRRRIKLKEGRWEQLYVTLQPAERMEIELSDPPSTSSRKAQSNSVICLSGKRALLSSKMTVRGGREDTARRNAPALQATVMQSFRAYGLDFIDGGGEETDFKELAARHQLQYLLKAVIDVRESPIKLLETSMKTVNAEITLQLLDLNSERVLASISRSFTQAGLDAEGVAQRQLKQLLPGMGAELANQACGKS